MTMKMIHGVRIGAAGALALAGTFGLMTEEVWSVAAGAGLMALAVGALRRWGPEGMGLEAGRLWRRCEELMRQEDVAAEVLCPEETGKEGKDTAAAPAEEPGRQIRVKVNRKIREDAQDCRRVMCEF